MASALVLKDDKANAFFQCSVCLEDFKEPKKLPCLHRYCKGCLSEIMTGYNGTFICPLCKRGTEIPQEGADGFNTDFHMKDLLHALEPEKNDGEDRRKCDSCENVLIVISYCFRCMGFLCVSCNQSHLDSDHKKNVTSLEDTARQNLTIGKLASLSLNPNCHYHSNKPATLCCATCRNLPVCKTCTKEGGLHHGHDARTVSEIAHIEREKLKKQMDILRKHEKMWPRPDDIQAARDKLEENITAKRDILQSQYDEVVGKIMQELKDADDELERETKEIQDNEAKRLAFLEQERDQAIRELHEKYDKMQSDMDARIDEDRRKNAEAYRQRDEELTRQLQVLEDEYKAYGRMHRNERKS